MDFKKTNAEPSTVTRDIRLFDEPTGNLYEAVAIIAKRANQISIEMKEELQGKLSEFSTNNDNLEEIFENREQIEISKMYERMANAPLQALTEFNDDKIYYRKK